MGTNQGDRALRTDGFEVRVVRPEEYRAAGRVTALAYSEFAPGPGAPDYHDWQGYLAELEDVAGRVDRLLVLVAVEGSRVLGCVSLELTQTLGDDDEELEPDAAHVRMFGVDPAAQGRGVGKALVLACIDRARREGKRFVTLRTTAPMTAARGLYGSMGFVPDPDNDLWPDPDFQLIAYRLAL